MADHGWDDPALEKLWRYNLHYFDDLGAPFSPERSAWQRLLLERWVSENAPGVGSGWEPYPTSIRIINWIKWARAGHVLPSACVHSLAIQARWLMRRLEVHLLGNHLFTNGKALVFAGLYFDGPEAGTWLRRGLQILERELAVQILSDGGQFERSPMYHALAVEDLLDLYNVMVAYAAPLSHSARVLFASLPARLAAMRRWMLLVQHPDGDIAFFNDSAIDIAPSSSVLEEYAARLGLDVVLLPIGPVTMLESSGYIRVETEDAVALLDVAPVGPDYLPGHAHADTLSFELSMFGQRVFVNSGTSLYGIGAERLRQRGTAAHNTVVVNDLDSSEVWGGFRVARRARPTGLSVSTGHGVVVRCGHDGYRRLPGGPVHERVWTFEGRTLTIDDCISTLVDHAEARYHLHPSVSLDLDASPRARGSMSVIVLKLPRGQRLRVVVESGLLEVGRTTWHPEFGSTIPNSCLIVHLMSGRSRLRLAWPDGT